MGKSYRGCNKATVRCHGSDAENIFVALSDIFVSEATWAKLIARDGQQIEQYRQAYENGEEMVRVVLRPRLQVHCRVRCAALPVATAAVARSKPESRPLRDSIRARLSPLAQVSRRR